MHSVHSNVLGTYSKVLIIAVLATNLSDDSTQLGREDAQGGTLEDYFGQQPNHYCDIVLYKIRHTWKERGDVRCRN